MTLLSEMNTVYLKRKRDGEKETSLLYPGQMPPDEHSASLIPTQLPVFRAA
jgi:hypothetical protein